jgi:hypothetical protein
LEWGEVGEETCSGRWKRNDMAKFLGQFLTYSPRSVDIPAEWSEKLPSVVEGLKLEKFLMDRSGLGGGYRKNIGVN